MAKDYTPSAANRAAYEKLSDAQVVGTVPPQAVELEEAVLGALMLEKDAVIEVRGNYVLFIVSKDCAAAQQAFLDAL